MTKSPNRMRNVLFLKIILVYTPKFTFVQYRGYKNNNKPFIQNSYLKINKILKKKISFV